MPMQLFTVSGTSAHAPDIKITHIQAISHAVASSFHTALLLPVVQHVHVEIFLLLLFNTQEDTLMKSLKTLESIALVWMTP